MNGPVALTYTDAYAVVHQNGPFNYRAFLLCNLIKNGQSLYVHVYTLQWLIQSVQVGNTTPLNYYDILLQITLSLAENSQIRLDHRASSRLAQGRQGCGCCAATERATPTISISAKGCLRCSSNAAQRENATTPTDSWDTTSTYITF